MEENKFDVIMKLMEELKSEMQYSPDEIGERLGRKKPEIEVVKIEGEIPMEGMEEEMPEMGMMEEELSPADKLKKRLSKIRA